MNRPFVIDFRKWVLMLFPPRLRKPVLYHLVYRMLTPVASMFSSFKLRRETNLLYAKYDSSYGNIERMLNVLFPSEEGKIKVRKADMSEVLLNRVYVTVEQSGMSAYVGQSYIDKAVPQPLFDVIVPNDIKSKAGQISDVVGRYCLPGYGYRII